MKKLTISLLFVIFFASSLFSRDPYFVIKINDAQGVLNFLSNSSEMETFLKLPSYEFFSTTRVFLKLKNRIENYSTFSGIDFGKDFLFKITGNKAYIWGFDISDTLFVYQSDVNDFLGSEIYDYMVKNFSGEKFLGGNLYFKRKGDKVFAFFLKGKTLFVSNSLNDLKDVVENFQGKFAPKNYFGSDNLNGLLYEVFLDLGKLVKTPQFRRYYRFKGDYVNFKWGKISLYRVDDGFYEVRKFFNGSEFQLEKKFAPLKFEGDRFSLVREIDISEISRLIENSIFGVENLPKNISFTVRKSEGKFTRLDGNGGKMGEVKEEVQFKKAIDELESYLLKKVKRVFAVDYLGGKEYSIKWFKPSNGILLISKDTFGDEDVDKMSNLILKASSDLYLSDLGKIKKFGDMREIKFGNMGETIYLKRIGDRAFLISRGNILLEQRDVEKLNGVYGSYFEMDVVAYRNFFKKYSKLIDGGRKTIFSSVVPSLFEVGKRVKRIEFLKRNLKEGEVIFAFYQFN